MTTTKVTADTVIAVANAAYLTAITVTSSELGLSGAGGNGGAGGDGGTGASFFGGGTGGAGGSGGDAVSTTGAIGGEGGSGGTGGTGGFGAGGGQGGAGANSGDDGNGVTHNGGKGDGGDGGLGGFGGGDGGSGVGGSTLGGGNGGSGLGGSIFVRDGGSLTIKGDTTFGRGKVRGGAGDVANHGSSGDAAGTDLFMMKGSNVVLDAGAGKTITFNGTIADDSSASIDGYGNAEGDGASLTIRSGLVVFNGENTYTGQTILEGGVLKAVDGETLHASSNINFASNREGGILLVNTGVFDRFTGTAGDRVQWTGSGGFAAEEQDLSVELSGGLERTWGVEGFVGGNNALILGAADSTHKVTLENDINLNGQNGTVLVKANANNDNYGILNGVLRNGSLTVGDANHTGTLLLTKANTYADGTVVNGGELRLVEEGALNANGKVEVNNGATLDTSSTGDQAIGTLAGNGAVKLGSNTLTLNQNGDTTFAGNIQDGGVAGGTGSGIVKNGSGTLTITAQNAYTGKTQINAGQIVLDGSLSTDAVHVATGATLTNNSGGLEADVALSNDGLINQNHDDTVASLVNTGTINGSQTLTAQTYALNDGSVINAHLGSGVLTANGTVQVNGTSKAEAVTIASGTTTLGSAERLLDSSDVTVDGKLVMGGDETIGTLAGNQNGVLELSGAKLTLNHAGKETTYAGVIQDNQNGAGSVQKDGNGKQILTGANTYRGHTQINGGIIALNDTGSLQSQTVTIAKDGTLINHNQDNNGLSDTSVVTSAGVIEQNSDDTIKTLINTGTINGDKTLSADTYALNDGSVINAHLGSGVLAANGTVQVNGTSKAETVNIETGTTTLGSAERLLDSSDVTVNANLVLGGDETIGTLTGAASGNVDLNGGKLTLKQNTDTTFAGVIQDSESGQGSLQKDGSGSITLSGASTYAGHTQINSGKVVLDGSLASQSMTVAQGATLDDNNGGLSTLAAVSNDGIVNLNADDTIASFSSTGTLNNASHTLTANTYDLNDGSIINANLGTGTLTSNGNVLLNGSSSAATVTIASGITTLGAPERLLDSSDVSVNGKLIMGGAETIGTLAGNGDGVLELSGAKLTLKQNKDTTFAGVIQDSSLPNSGSLQKDGSGKLTLSGANTYTGNTQINSGKLVLDGSLESQSITVASGATLDNQQGGLSATAALNNSGTLNQNANDSIKTLVNSGTISGSGTLTADSYTLNGGAVINANLGSGTLETHGKVTLNGTSQAASVRVYDDSELTLNGENRLYTAADARVDGKLILGGGNQTLRSLIGTGLVDVTAYKLTVTQGGAFSGNINAGSTDLDVSSGQLDLTQGTTTTQSTTVAAGTTLSVTDGATLNSATTTVGGTLTLGSSSNLVYTTLSGRGTVQAASFDNKVGSTVKGFLTFTGDYVNNGKLAPGNSPGQTVIIGNFINNGLFEAELQNTTPITGYDQTSVGGTVTLGAASELVVQTYGGTAPVRGNSYQIIADLAGNAKAVNGTFGSVKYDADGLAGAGIAVSNAAIVFDVATGKVLATGQNGAASTFADMGSTTSQRAAAAALLNIATTDVGQNQIDSASTVGQLAAQFITANGSSAAANAERFTPEYYGAMADNALRTGELVSGLLLQRTTTALDSATPVGQGSAFVGYLYDEMETANKTGLERRDFYVGGEYRIGEAFTLGTVLLDGSGDLSARFGSGNSKVHGASLFARLSVNPSLDVLASVSHSSYDYQLSRSTVVGQTSANTEAKALTASLAAVYRAQITPQLAILPRVGLSHGKASVNGLLEQGSATDRLDLAGFDAQQSKAQIGATWLWTSLDQGQRWNVALDLGLEHAFSDRKDAMQATLASDHRVSFPVTFASERKTLLNFGISANYGFSKNLSLSASLEGRSNVDGQSGKLGMNYIF
ncbi:autotransporter-associated beta strand repeat-containing protein [Vogesella indigofera]|uniref:autotransporter-associated beta strand repeat-containing protein n=1 Tax=Vogesella indigofera TaxID=45465 RepID=UPI0011C3EE2F|nr:autotransporter-associated beta strand repeat-containing protein [Vogesella indigofera]